MKIDQALAALKEQVEALAALVEQGHALLGHADDETVFRVSAVGEEDREGEEKGGDEEKWAAGHGAHSCADVRPVRASSVV